MAFGDTSFLKKKVNALGFFNEDQLRRVTPDIERNTYNAGEVLLLRGEVSTGFYIIKKGKAVASYKKKAGSTVQIELNVGDFFGEISLLEDGASDASIKAAEDETVVLTMPHESFEKLLEFQPLLKTALLKIASERKKKLPPQ